MSKALLAHRQDLSPVLPAMQIAGIPLQARASAALLLALLISGCGDGTGGGTPFSLNTGSIGTDSGQPTSGNAGTDSDTGTDSGTGSPAVDGPGDRIETPSVEETPNGSEDTETDDSDAGAPDLGAAEGEVTDTEAGESDVPEPGATEGEGTGEETVAGTDADSGSMDINEQGTGTSLPDVIACDAPREHIQQRFIELVNEARAQARFCGSKRFEPAPAVTWNDKLESAARVHSSDMARHNFFSHTGSDGSSSGQRVSNADYTWWATGENIAAGQFSVRAAVDGWIDSPGHCRNLMSPDFEEVALACVIDTGSNYSRYWTNSLASPR